MGLSKVQMGQERYFLVSSSASEHAHRAMSAQKLPRRNHVRCSMPTGHNADGYPDNDGGLLKPKIVPAGRS